MAEYPKTFWLNILAGVALGVLMLTTAYTVAQLFIPFHRPTLQLLSDQVPAGGYLQFVQATTPPKSCSQEQSRQIWRWETPEKERRISFLLSDANIPPPLWDGPTVITVRIPLETSPGEWYYVRTSETWCSLLNYVFGATRSRTPDVRFTVLPAGTQPQPKQMLN